MRAWSVTVILALFATHALAKPARAELQIASAIYGMNSMYCNATAVIAAQCNGQKGCTIAASNDLCGDPIFGTVKQLSVRYSCGAGLPYSEATVREGDQSTLECIVSASTPKAPPQKILVMPQAPSPKPNARNVTPTNCRGIDMMDAEGHVVGQGSVCDETPVVTAPPAANPLKIATAFYGQNGKTCNATAAIQQLCAGKDACLLESGNQLCGNSSGTDANILKLRYMCNDSIRSVSIPQGQSETLRCHDSFIMIGPLMGLGEEQALKDLTAKCEYRAYCRFTPEQLKPTLQDGQSLEVHIGCSGKAIDIKQLQKGEEFEICFGSGNECQR